VTAQRAQTVAPYLGEPEKPITLSGKRLGAVVAWMAPTTPGALTMEDTWHAEGVRFDLKGLAEEHRPGGPLRSGANQPILALLPLARLGPVLRLRGTICPMRRSSA
jgi:hypothetical protein